MLIVAENMDIIVAAGSLAIIMAQALTLSSQSYELAISMFGEV